MEISDEHWEKEYFLICRSDEGVSNCTSRMSEQDPKTVDPITPTEEGIQIDRSDGQDEKANFRIRFRLPGDSKATTLAAHPAKQ
jgi:hypothetical protein